MSHRNRAHRAVRHARGALLASVAAVLFAMIPDLSAQDFRRGDVDGDGVVTIHDALVFSENLLPHSGGGAVTCFQTMDVDDNNLINVSDMISLLGFISGDGFTPPLPGPETCGPDPTTGPIDCDFYDCVPSPFPSLPEVTFTLGSAFGTVGDLVTVDLTYEASGNLLLHGFQVSVCHDPSIASLVSVEEFGMIFGNDNLPEVAFFQAVTLESDSWSGSTMSGFPVGLPVENYVPLLARITYELVAPGTSPIAVCSGDSRTEVVLDDTALYGAPATVDGLLGVDLPTDFRRGDANQDGLIDIGDPIFSLAALFSGGAPPTCPDAADANDDGMHDLADAISVLGFLFSSTAPPSAPGPITCGPDPTADALSCPPMSCTP